MIASAERMAGTVRSVAAFVRLSALGGTYALVAAGATSGHRLPSRSTVVLLVALATLFHVFAYVSNDVADLDVDRTEPRRAANPLVTGRLQPRAALTLSGVAAMVAIVLAFRLGGSTGAVFACIAVGGLAVYNAWGKRCPWPPATDLVQGVGWAALVAAAARASGGPSLSTAWLTAATVAFILLANGVHGGLRDLENDARHGVRSTAIFAGATTARGGSLHIPRALRRYAFLLHWLTSALVVAFVLSGNGGDGGPRSLVTVTLVVVLAVLGYGALRAAARTGAVGAREAGMVHLVALLALFVVAAAARLPNIPAIAVVLAYFAPLCAHPRLPDAARWFWRDSRVGLVCRLTRLPNAIVAAAATVIGAYLSRPGALNLSLVWRAAAAVAFVVAFGNTVNDLADVAVDRIRRPDRPLPSTRLSLGAARVIATVTGCSGLLLATTVPATAAAFVVANLALSVAYDVRLKGSVLAGNAAVALLSASTLPFGAVVASGRVAPALLAGALVFAFMMAFEVLKDIDDREADAAVGLRTVATVLGPARALQISRALPAALVGLGLAGWWLGLASARYLVPAVPTTLGPAVAATVLVRGVPGPNAIRSAIRVLKAGWLSGLAVLILLR